MELIDGSVHVSVGVSVCARLTLLPTIPQLCFLSLKNILVELAPDEHGRAKKCFMCNIWDVQLDSYLGATPFKIAVYPAVKPADDDRSDGVLSKKPFLGVDMRLSEHPRNWIFDLLTVKLHPMHVRLDQRLITFLKSLFATYTETDPVRLDDHHDPFSSERRLGEGEMGVPAGQQGIRALAQMCFSANWNFDPTSAEAVADVLRVTNKPTTFLHFKVFNIAEIHANISFATSFTNSTTDDSSHLAKTLSQLRDTPVKFSRITLLKRDFQGSSDLQAILADAYSRDIKHQGARLVGSLNALGNFTGLFENVADGGADFIVGLGDGMMQVWYHL